METSNNKKNKKITTIKLENETKERLDKFKEHEKESYNEIIKKILYIINLFRKNPESGNKMLATIDKTIKRRKVYLRILSQKNSQSENAKIS